MVPSTATVGGIVRDRRRHAGRRGRPSCSTTAPRPATCCRPTTRSGGSSSPASSRAPTRSPPRCPAPRRRCCSSTSSPPTSSTSTSHLEPQASLFGQVLRARRGDASSSSRSPARPSRAVRRRGLPRHARRRRWPSTTTDADGRYTFAGLDAPDDFVVAVYAVGDRRRRARLRARADPAERGRRGADVPDPAGDLTCAACMRSTPHPGADGGARRAGDVPAAHREHRVGAAALPAARRRLRRRPRAAAAADRAARRPASRRGGRPRVRHPRRLRRRAPLRRRRGASRTGRACAPVDRRRHRHRRARSTTSPSPSCRRRSGPTGGRRSGSTSTTARPSPIDLDLAGEGPDLERPPAARPGRAAARRAGAHVGHGSRARATSSASRSSTA